MVLNTAIQHVALVYPDEKQADLFFTEVLGLSKVKNFHLSQELSRQIFGIAKDVKVVVYGDDRARFEVFIDAPSVQSTFIHTCIMVDDKQELLSRCRKYGIEIRIIQKNSKELLFIRDVAHNLYEVKEN